MANDITTAIKFLKKTYPLRDKNAVSKTEDQTINGNLDFTNGISLFGTNISITVKEDNDYIINFGGGEANDISSPLIMSYIKALQEILNDKGIQATSEEFDELLKLVQNDLFYMDNFSWYDGSYDKKINVNI